MFKVTTEISHDAMRDILITAFESGHYGSLVLVKYGKTVPRENGGALDPKWLYPRYCTDPLNGGSVYVKTKYSEDNKDPKLGGVKIVNKKSLQKGLNILQEKYPHLLAQLVAGEYDVIAPDALLQCAVFDDLIYA